MLAAGVHIPTLSSHSCEIWRWMKPSLVIQVAFQDWTQDGILRQPRYLGMREDRDPKTVQKLYDAKDLDFRLKPGAVAIDKGVVIPNVNDGFAGNAPDLGALEVGQAAPVYGPRSVR